MTPSMKNVLYTMAAVLLLAGCFHEPHEQTAGTGAVALALQWEQSGDAATPIHNITCTIGGITRVYAGAEEAAGELLHLPAGEYDLLVTANMTESEGYILGGLPAAKAGLPEVGVSLRDPASNPSQAWFAVARARVREGEVSVVEARLQRLLSTLTVNIANLPAGTAVTRTLSNVAGEVILTAQDGGGRYGIPGSVTAPDITLPGHSTNLLPAAAGAERCLLTLSLVTPAGIPLTVVCDVPRTEAGKGYTLDLDYTRLRPYMYIDSSSINPWADGWTVSGEILNPENIR